MDYNLKIPKNLRFKFTEPLDILIAGIREETIKEVENIFRDFIKHNEKPNFYIVGDVVAQDFLSNKFLRTFIKLCIVDEKTKRSPVEIKLEEFFDEILTHNNPEGTISKESWKILKSIVNSSKRTLLKITEGEEDLLVLPLILELPLLKRIKNFVFYGQPPITDSNFLIPEGIVIVDVDEEIQNKVKETIALMKKY
jgi:uncharacterized protein (UPF0218 family)